MTGRDVGVFLNAHHLATVAPEQRSPAVLLEQVGNATTQLLLAGAVSHRVIAGDCGVAPVRELAEQYAVESGFLVRHCPPAGPAVATVLMAEIAAAALATPELRAVVIGDEMVDYAPMAETLRRSGRWTISLTTEGGAAPAGTADLRWELRLDRGRRREELVEIYARLAAEADAEGVDLGPARVNSGFQRAIPGFNPRLLGYRNLDELVSDVRPRSAPLRKPAPPPSPRQRLVQVGRTVAVPAPPASREEHVDLVVRLLEAWAADPEVLDTAQREGLPFSWLPEALGAVVPQWSLPDGLSMTALCRNATARASGWLAVRGGQGMQSRLVHAVEPPEGYVAV